MKISIKKRKLNDGSFSLYLEYYFGYEKTPEGKIKHHRKKENLNLQIYNKPKTPHERKSNSEVLELAEKILIRKKSDFNENNYDMFNGKRLNTNLIQYFEKIKDKKNSSYSNKKLWINTIHYLNKFCESDTITFKQVNEQFVTNFKDFLLNQKKIHNNTSSGYFEAFRSGLKIAFKEGILKENPAKNVTSIKIIEAEREYLTLEEIQILAKVDCDNNTIKRAFLFACLTGLRWCDIYKLKWDEIIKNGESYKIIFRQQKTKSVEYIPLSGQAVELLGEPGDSEDKVFQNINYTTDAYYKLQTWGIKAGIEKKITFHMARHSFATMQLTYGTDIYTVSKLLGHKKIQTTQIYAKVIDEKKREAVNKIPEIKLNN